MLGCGNADFSASLFVSHVFAVEAVLVAHACVFHWSRYDWGATNITNIDLSSVVISQMSAANKASRPHMKYLVMDVQALSFDDASFDIVIDKSTMDCLFCCENSTEIVCNMLTEGYRVLKPGGNYISMSLHDEAKVRGSAVRTVGKHTTDRGTLDSHLMMWPTTVPAVSHGSPRHSLEGGVGADPYVGCYIVGCW